MRHVETRCSECQSSGECLCKCRNRIRLVAKEIDAMGVVIEEARPVAKSGAKQLAEALAAYDAAVAAREAAP